MRDNGHSSGRGGAGHPSPPPYNCAMPPLTVHLFASAADHAGRTLSVPHPPALTVAALRRLLTDTAPSLADLLPRCAVAVNHEYAADDTAIAPGDEVAVIPPVSGG